VKVPFPFREGKKAEARRRSKWEGEEGSRDLVGELWACGHDRGGRGREAAQGRKGSQRAVKNRPVGGRGKGGRVRKSREGGGRGLGYNSRWDGEI